MSVRFLLDVRVKADHREQLLAAYRALCERVREQPGLISHQLCESRDVPERWIVISEWDSLPASAAWDKSDEHARLIGPMRACFAGASATRYDVRDGV